MKLVLSRLDLASLIGKVQGIIVSKPPSPIMACVLLEAVADMLTLSVTDGSISMKVAMPAQVIEEGSIALPAQKFFSLIRELLSPTIEIDTDLSGMAHIRASSSRFKLNGVRKEEFPDFPRLEGGTSFQMGSHHLKEMISRATFAASQNESRQLLGSLCLQLQGKTAYIVATNGKQVAKLSSPITSDRELEGLFIIPLKAVDEMKGLLTQKEETTATLTLLPDKMGLEVGSSLLITKLFSGKFPDTSRILPQKAKEPLVLHKEELAALLRQVSVLSGDTKLVRFTFMPGELHLISLKGDAGEGVVSMAVNYGGEKCEMGFNAHNFLSILAQIKDETFDFSFTTPVSPTLFTDSTTAEFMLVPMHLE